MTPMNPNPIASEPNADPTASREAVVGVDDYPLSAAASEANEAPNRKTCATEFPLQAGKNTKWRWIGAVVSFCLGWYLFTAVNSEQSPAQASPASATSATPLAASTSRVPVEADVPRLPVHATTSAASVEDPVSPAQTQMAGGANSDRLRKIFEKSMQSADALK